MATVFSTAFKNALLQRLQGYAPNYMTPYYSNITNGGSTSVFSDVSCGPRANGWSPADNTATAYLINRTPYTAGDARAAAGLTQWAVYDNNQIFLFSTSIGLSEEPGVGAVVSTLNSSAGVGVTIVKSALKLALNSGGSLAINLALARRMVDMATGYVSSATGYPYMGVNTNGTCTVTVYSGAVPANADEPITNQTALCTFTCGVTNIWAVSNAVMGMNATLNCTASASGTATFARMVKANTSTGQTYVIQGSAGGPGADFVIGTSEVISGATYSLTDLVVTM